VSDFDARAATWDEDPRKQVRAVAVADAIRGAVPLTSAWTALEYGTGTGLLSFALQDDLSEITLADSSSGMLAVAERKIRAAGAAHMQTVALDLTNDPPPADRYDLLFSMMTLHHIADTAGILRTFTQLLASGGWLALADLDAEDGSFHGPDIDVHHGFQRDQLVGQMEAAGLSNVSISTCFEINRGTGSYPVFLAVGMRQ
jgi:ubiquinone/menaquinone biosynthesis C-methylase UbiE